MRFVVPILALVAMFAVEIIIGHLLARRLRSMPAVPRAILLAVLLALALIAPVQIFFSWSLTIPRSLTIDTSLLAYLFSIPVMWNAARGPQSKWVARAVSLCMAVPLIAAAVVSPILLILLLAYEFEGPPIVSDQISPTVTYEVHSSRGFNNATNFDYRIYRHPKWLPVLHKEIARGPLTSAPHSCQPDSSSTVDGRPLVSFSPGSDDHTVVVTCNNPTAPNSPSTTSAEIPLP